MRTRKTARLTDAEIRARGWEALIEALAPSGALRYATLTERGHGDYVKERHRILGSLSVDDLVARTETPTEFVQIPVYSLP